MKRIVKIILSWALVICIPVLALGISMNALFRLPDIYQFEMNSSQVLKDFHAAGQEEAVAQAIGKYMQYRSDELQYQYDEEEEMSLLFSRDEQDTMHNLRNIFNIIAAAAAFSLIVVLVAYIVLIKGEHTEIVRIRFKWSFLVHFILLFVISLFVFVPTLKDHMWLTLMPGLNETDLMYVLYASGFMKYFGVANIVVSLILMFIFMYITWKNTKPNKIFW